MVELTSGVGHQRLLVMMSARWSEEPEPISLRLVTRMGEPTRNDNIPVVLGEVVGPPVSTDAKLKEEVLS